MHPLWSLRTSVSISCLLTLFNRLFKRVFREGSLTALLRGHQPRIPRLHAAVRGGAGAAVPRGPGRELRHGGGHQVRPRARPAVPHRQHPPLPHGPRRGDTSQCSFILDNLDIAIGQFGWPFEDFSSDHYYIFQICYESVLHECINNDVEKCQQVPNKQCHISPENICTKVKKKVTRRCEH